MWSEESGFCHYSNGAHSRLHRRRNGTFQLVCQQCEVQAEGRTAIFGGCISYYDLGSLTSVTTDMSHHISIITLDDQVLHFSHRLYDDFFC